MAEETTNSTSTGVSLKPIIIISAVVGLLIVGTLGFGIWYISGLVGDDKPKQETKVKSAEFGVVVPVGEIKSNIGADGFVVTNVNLQVGNEEVKKELDSKMTAVRDHIIKIFRGQQKADLDKPDAQDNLAKQIKGAINEKLLASGQVENVYFSEFLVQ